MPARHASIASVRVALAGGVEGRADICVLRAVGS